MAGRGMQGSVDARIVFGAKGVGRTDGGAMQGLFDDYRSRSIHIATVTVASFTGKGDPEGIAEAFWALHAQPREAWASEVRYDPRG